MKIDSHIGSVNFKLDTDRMDHNFLEAQKLLNMQIVADCDPLVPFSQGALRGSVRYPKGIYGGEIMYDTPYAHYVYEGEVYGPNIPHYDTEGNLIGWSSPPQKYPTGRQMEYHTPGTEDHWFETAKSKHLNDWVRLAKQTAGKG